MPRKAKILLRRGTSSEWSSANPILDSGELGYDKTMGSIKVGDGSTNWNDLPFLSCLGFIATPNSSSSSSNTP
mgnify:CR=1 FL=1